MVIRAEDEDFYEEEFSDEYFDEYEGEECEFEDEYDMEDMEDMEEMDMEDEKVFDLKKNQYLINVSFEEKNREKKLI